MPQPSFKNAGKLAERVDAYFAHLEGEYHLETVSGEKLKIWDREAEPATIAGLALFLGFNSKGEFEDYEQNGKFSNLVKRSRLQIDAIYEKRLHMQSPSGAIFALKNLGGKEKPEDKALPSKNVKNFKIMLIETGPKPAANEQEVII